MKNKESKKLSQIEKHGDMTITSHVGFRIEFWTETDTSGETGEI